MIPRLDATLAQCSPTPAARGQTGASRLAGVAAAIKVRSICPRGGSNAAEDHCPPDLPSRNRARTDALFAHMADAAIDAVARSNRGRPEWPLEPAEREQRRACVCNKYIKREKKIIIRLRAFVRM